MSLERLLKGSLIGSLVALAGCPKGSQSYDEIYAETSGTAVEGLSPNDGAINVFPISSSLDWPNVSGASQYLLYIDESRDIGSGDFVGRTNVSNFSGLSLDFNTTYFWRVVAENSSWREIFTSQVWSFRTRPSLQDITDGHGGNGGDGVVPDLFSQIKAGIYSSDNVKVSATTIVLGERGSFEFEAYHAIAFDNTGYPYVEIDGKIVRAVAGLVDSTGSAAVNEIRSINAFGGGVEIIANASSPDLGYEGTRKQTYIFGAGGVRFDSELRMYDPSGQFGIESDYEGILTRFGDFSP